MKAVIIFYRRAFKPPELVEMLCFDLDAEINKALESVTTGNTYRPLKGAYTVHLTPILRVLMLFDKLMKSLQCDLTVNTWIKPGLILHVNII